jgi:hypothetical protein
MRSKIDKITKISDNVEYPKNQGVTYWAENYMPLFGQVIDWLQKLLLNHFLKPLIIQITVGPLFLAQ